MHVCLCVFQLSVMLTIKENQTGCFVWWMYGYSHLRFRYLCFDDLNREPNKNMKTDKTCRSLNFLFGCRIHNSNNGFKIFNCTFYFEVITLSKINTLYCSLRKIKWRVGFVFLWYNSSFQRYLLYKYRLPVVNLIPFFINLRLYL